MEPSIETLKQVIDPEFGLNIVDMGLVYDVQNTPDAVVVTMTLTTMTCPMSAVIVAHVKQAVREVTDTPCRVDLVWSPAWSPERISPEGLAFLGV
jgi:metal-sulfur cluster biosynthetic enzyme